MKTPIEEIPDDLWQLACAREAVIRPLAAVPHVGRAETKRLNDFDARKVTAARHGGKRAREMFAAALPQQRPDDPLSFVEIDHSPMDVIVVEEQTRLPLPPTTSC